MREQLGKPIPSPVVLGQVTEKFRDSVKAMGGEQIPLIQFEPENERTTSPTGFGRSAACGRDRLHRRGAGEGAGLPGQGGGEGVGQFQFTRDKTVYVNHYYFYIDDADFGPLFIKVCSYAPWA